MSDIFKKPKSLLIDENIAESLRKFQQSFSIYMTAAGSYKKEPEVKAAIFFNFIGEVALELFNAFKLNDVEKKDVDNIIKAFDEYIKPRRNVISERYKFYTRNQIEGVEFESFLLSIINLCKTCEFANADEMIRDIIEGVDG